MGISTRVRLYHFEAGACGGAVHAPTPCPSSPVPPIHHPSTLSSQEWPIVHRNAVLTQAHRPNVYASLSPRCKEISWDDPAIQNRFRRLQSGGCFLHQVFLVCDLCLYARCWPRFTGFRQQASIECGDP
jgi:hypothetical protein